MEAEAEAPSLTLVMLQGPVRGQTLHFPPGTAVRIGRVARGNTLPIKDAGISSKHLAIGFESGQWVIRDLDSSNGTVFNGTKIPPHTPFHLHNGDTIKIGEFTSIEVKLQLLHEVTTRLRRNPRRDAAENVAGSADVGSVAEEQGPEGESSDAPVQAARKPGRGRPRKGKVLKGEVGGELGKAQIQSIDENVDVNDGKESGNVNLGSLQEKVEQQQRQPQPMNTWVTRNSKKKQSVIEISDSIVGNGPQNSGLECRIENVDAKKTRVGTRRRKLQEEAPSLCAQVAELEEGKVDVAELNHHGLEDGGGSKDEDGKFWSAKESCNGREVQNCCEQKEENLKGDDGSWPDLEKLTLAQWFDFLEVHLPKQITDATEEMVDTMRQKAERLREYIISQKNEKGKMPMA